MLAATPDLVPSVLPSDDFLSAINPDQPPSFHPGLSLWDSEPMFANMPELDAGMGFDFADKGGGLLEDSSSLMASFASINSSYTFPPLATESPSSSNSILSYEPREGGSAGSQPQPTMKSTFSSLEDVAPRSVVSCVSRCPNHISCVSADAGHLRTIFTTSVSPCTDRAPAVIQPEPARTQRRAR